MYKKVLALNDLKWSICYKTKQNQIITVGYILQMIILIFDNSLITFPVTFQLVFHKKNKKTAFYP